MAFSSFKKKNYKFRKNFVQKKAKYSFKKKFEKKNNKHFKNSTKKQYFVHTQFSNTLEKENADNKEIQDLQENMSIIFSKNSISKYSVLTKKLIFLKVYKRLRKKSKFFVKQIEKKKRFIKRKFKKKMVVLNRLARIKAIKKKRKQKLGNILFQKSIFLVSFLKKHKKTAFYKQLSLQKSFLFLFYRRFRRQTRLYNVNFKRHTKVQRYHVKKARRYLDSYILPDFKKFKERYPKKRIFFLRILSKKFYVKKEKFKLLPSIYTHLKRQSIKFLQYETYERTATYKKLKKKLLKFQNARYRKFNKLSMKNTRAVFITKKQKAKNLFFNYKYYTFRNNQFNHLYKKYINKSLKFSYLIKRRMRNVFEYFYPKKTKKEIFFFLTKQGGALKYFLYKKKRKYRRRFKFFLTLKMREKWVWKKRSSLTYFVPLRAYNKDFLSLIGNVKTQHRKQRKLNSLFYSHFFSIKKKKRYIIKRFRLLKKKQNFLIIKKLKIKKLKKKKIKNFKLKKKIKKIHFLFLRKVLLKKNNYLIKKIFQKNFSFYKYKNYSKKFVLFSTLKNVLLIQKKSNLIRLQKNLLDKNKKKKVLSIYLNPLISKKFLLTNTLLKQIFFLNTKKINKIQYFYKTILAEKLKKKNQDFFFNKKLSKLIIRESKYNKQNLMYNYYPKLEKSFFKTNYLLKTVKKDVDFNFFKKIKKLKTVPSKQLFFHKIFNVSLNKQLFSKYFIHLKKKQKKNRYLKYLLENFKYRNFMSYDEYSTTKMSYVQRKLFHNTYRFNLIEKKLKLLNLLKYETIMKYKHTNYLNSIYNLNNNYIFSKKQFKKNKLKKIISLFAKKRFKINNPVIKHQIFLKKSAFHRLAQKILILKHFKNIFKKKKTSLNTNVFLFKTYKHKYKIPFFNLPKTYNKMLFFNSILTLYRLKKNYQNKLEFFKTSFYYNRFINLTNKKKTNKLKRINFLIYFTQLKRILSKETFFKIKNKKLKFRKLKDNEKIKNLIFYKKFKKLSLTYNKAFGKKAYTYYISKYLMSKHLEQPLDKKFFYINNKHHNIYFSTLYFFRKYSYFKYPYRKNFFKLKKGITFKKTFLSNFYTFNLSKTRFVKPQSYVINSFEKKKALFFLHNKFFLKKRKKSWIKFYKVQEHRYLLFKKRRKFRIKRKWYLKKKKTHYTPFLRLRSFLLTSIVHRFRFNIKDLIEKRRYRKFYEQFQTHRLNPTVLIPEHLVYYEYKNKKQVLLEKKTTQLQKYYLFKNSIKNQNTRYKKRIIFRKIKKKDRKLKSLLYLKRKKYLKVYYKKLLFFKSIFLRYYGIKNRTFKKSLKNLHHYKQFNNNYLFPDKKITLLVSKLESRLINVVGRLFKINFLVASKIIDSYGIFVNNQLITKRSWTVQKGNLIELPLKVYLKYFNYFNIKFFSYDLTWKINLNYIVNYKILAGIFLDYPFFTQLKYPKLHGFTKKFIRFFINFIK